VPSRRSRRASRSERDVFINVPFDRKGERVFVALICGLVALGLNPRSIVEIDPDRSRLDRLFGLISGCGYSVHDLSRVTLARGGTFRVPRFNMPFELGLAVAVGFTPAFGVRHRWRVLEQVPHRLTVSLSDLGGYDPAIYEGTIKGLFGAVADLFDVPHAPLRSEADMTAVYREVRKVRARLGRDVFRREAFRQLVVAARVVVEEFANAKRFDRSR
jgi:hypothetical protein